MDLNAGFNFGYEGVYYTDDDVVLEDGLTYLIYDDRSFKDTLVLDLSGHVNITENAAIEFAINNLTDSIGHSVATNANPWLRGRSYWVGSTVRF